MIIELAGKKTTIVTYGRPLDPDKPTILLIHGAGMNGSVWASQGRYFAFHGWNAIVPDLPGHGRSDGPPLASVPAMAAWIGQLAGQLELGNVVLAGHSMGSLVALEAAKQLGSSCRGLVLLGSTVSMQVHPILLAAAANDQPAAGAMIADWGLPRSIETSSQPVPSSSLHWSVRRLLETSGAGALAASLEACNNYSGASEAAGAVTCPTLLLVGSTDRMASLEGAATLAARLASAEIRTIEGAEHMMLAEQPRVTLSAMRDFLAGC